MEGKMKMDEDEDEDEDGTTHSLPFTLPSAKSVKLYPAPSLNLFNNVGSKVASSTETSKVSIVPRSVIQYEEVVDE